MSVGLGGNRTGNIRYARNSVTTSGETNNLSLAVTSVFGKKSGTATINEFDDASLEKTVRRAEEIAQLAPENPEYVPMLGPQNLPGTQKLRAIYGQDRRLITAPRLLLTVSIPVAKRTSSRRGTWKIQPVSAPLATAKACLATITATSVDFSITVRTADGLGSGYAIRDVNDVSKLSTKAATEVAMQKALASVNARALEPGKYTVILEPAAAVDLLQNMMGNMDARSADEGRSIPEQERGRNPPG